jgi:hypothetical protein
VVERLVGRPANWLALGRVAQLRRQTGHLQVALGELLAALNEIEVALREDRPPEAAEPVFDELLVSGHEAAINVAVMADEIDTAWSGLDEAISGGGRQMSEPTEAIEGAPGPKDQVELLGDLLAKQLAEILALRAEVAELKRRLGKA